MSRAKILYVILDGLGDRPVATLGGRTLIVEVKGIPRRATEPDPMRGMPRRQTRECRPDIGSQRRY